MAIPARIRILSAALVCVGAAWAAPRRPLDRVRVHALYHDGEFERILRELEPYGKGQCACAKDDSIFAEKHLAVVFAAAPATRELGRYHMFRLLDLSPRADLLDMYVGEEVDAVFEKVRKEHDLRAADPLVKRPGAAAAAIAHSKPVATPNGSAPRTAPAPRPSESPAGASASAAPAPAPVPAGPAAQAPAPAYSDAWAQAAQAASRPRSYAGKARLQAASRFQPAPAKAYTPWDAPVADLSTRAPGGHSAAVPSADSSFGPTQAPAPASEAASQADTSRPAWKQPGIWIGGGAAIAAIAFTIWHAGSDGGGPGKTYAVPASLSK